MKKRILLLAGLVFSSMSIIAQDRIQTDTIGVKVYFRQGYSIFEPDFRENGIRLGKFAEQLEKAGADSLVKTGTIHIVGAASPEGIAKMNQRLSEKRAETLIAWLRQNLPLPDSSFSKEGIGVDWKGLTRLVENSEMPYREDVLDILYNTPEWVIRNGVVVDGRQRQLGMLHGGQAWWYMEKHFFPELRSSAMEIYCEITVPAPAPVPEEVLPEPDTTGLAGVPAVPADTLQAPDTSAAQEPAAVTEPEPAPVAETPSVRKPFYMALKTNMLYDAALVPNAGVEFHIADGWSIGANWMYAWWKSDRHARYWRTYGGDLAVRKYFGKKAEEKPLQGHHLGVYGQMLTYDFELGGRGYLGDRWSWGAGIEYGYSLPVARRINIDFSLGLGYLGGEYKEYLPMDGHYVWQATRNRHWVGPTKAEITFVWLLGYGNTNPDKEKGGRR